MFAGNNRLKIYGLLTCGSGRKMRKENRIFFRTEEEAVGLGFRPCGHCMRSSYEHWKK
jgi:methylphosphotriester-DNA--protein-cysteine methyltransferase